MAPGLNGMAVAGAVGVKVELLVTDALVEELADIGARELADIGARELADIEARELAALPLDALWTDSHFLSLIKTSSKSSSSSSASETSLALRRTSIC